MRTFNANRLAACMLGVSTEETRYYLHGVYFTGQMAVATDGHIIVLAHDDQAEHEDDSIIYKIPKKAHAYLKRTDAERVEIQEDILRILDHDGETIALHKTEIVDGTFPDFKKAMPRKLGSECCGYFSNVVLKKLTDIAAIAARSVGQKVGVLKMTGVDNKSPHFISFSDPHIFAIAMPMMGFNHPEEYPEWADMGAYVLEEAPND